MNLLHVMHNGIKADTYSIQEFRGLHRRFTLERMVDLQLPQSVEDGRTFRIATRDRLVARLHLRLLHDAASDASDNEEVKNFGRLVHLVDQTTPAVVSEENILQHPLYLRLPESVQTKVTDMLKRILKNMRLIRQAAESSQDDELLAVEDEQNKFTTATEPMEKYTKNIETLTQKVVHRLCGSVDEDGKFHRNSTNSTILIAPCSVQELVAGLAVVGTAIVPTEIGKLLDELETSAIHWE